MSFNVFTIPPFDKQLKRLVKKYPSLKSEYSHLIQQLEIEPEIGVSLANSCHKIRIAIKSKSKGKSAGAELLLTFRLQKAMFFF
jgi:mRNA-degrading endonuclease RelE of RelBE toxin-antitoxin system